MDEIKTERLDIYLATDEEMRTFVEHEPVAELRQAYSEMLDGCLQHPELRMWYGIWFMVLREDHEVVVGNLSFKGISDDGCVEIGYGLSSEFEHQGYMTEAVTAMARWAASQPAVTRVEAETEPQNEASQRVLQRAGFVPNGELGEEGPRFVLRI